MHAPRWTAAVTRRSNEPITYTARSLSDFSSMIGCAPSTRQNFKPKGSAKTGTGSGAGFVLAGYNWVGHWFT